MSKDLQERLRLLRNVQGRVDPDEAWVRKTRETVLMQVRNTMPSEPLNLRAQVVHTARSFRLNDFFQWLRGPVVATLSVIVIVFSGSIASVSAAGQSLPGDFLYSLKLVAEQAQLALTSTKEEKLKLKIEFTQRRGDELKRVATENVTSKPARVMQTAEILKRDLDTVKKQLDEVNQTSPAPKVIEVAKLVDQTSNSIVQKLQETKTSLTDASVGKVIEAQAAAADAGVKAIEVLVEKKTESQESVTTSDVVFALESHTKTVADATGIAPTTTATVNLVTATGTSTTEELGQFVQQMKVATQQAFADAVASSTAMLASSTTVLVDGSVATGSSMESGTTSTSGSAATSTSGSTSSTAADPVSSP